MLIQFLDDKLRRTYQEQRNVARLGDNVFRAFIRAVDYLAAAQDERQLYQRKGFHYEALKGDREGQRSIRLNSQFRLILRVETLDDGTTAYIIEVVDYH